VIVYLLVKTTNSTFKYIHNSTIIKNNSKLLTTRNFRCLETVDNNPTELLT